MISAVLLCLSLVAQPTSQPSSVGAAPKSTIQLKVRVVYAAKKQDASLDPRLTDLFGSLRHLTYDTFELKEEKTLSLSLEGESKMSLPGGRTLIISPREVAIHNKKRRVRVKFDVAELKFSSRVWINEGSTLLVGGGPKLDDGVLLFAVGVNEIR